jgi:hypothetical protein
VRYLGAGAVSAATYYGLFAAIWLIAGGRISYLIVAVVANAATAASTYSLYRRVVWRSPAAGLRGFLRFYVVCLSALAYSFVGLPLLVEWAGLPVLVAQAIVVITSPLINYQLQRFWTFRPAVAEQRDERARPIDG